MAVIQQQPTFNQQAASIENQKKLAQMLRSQAKYDMAPNASVSVGPYTNVIPMSPIAALAQGLREGVASYNDASASKQEAELADKKQQALSTMFSGENDPTMQDMAQSGLFGGDVLVNALLKKQQAKEAAALKAEERKQKLEDPTNDMRNALWASGGDETKARELLQNKIQNPLGMLNYQLQAQNIEADNARQNQAQELQQQRFKFEQDQAQKAAQDRESKAAEARLQNVPPTHRMAYAENNNALSKIDQAIELINQNPDALGYKNFLGDTINQRLDEAGVPVRAAIAEIGGVKLHDLSGAAVSPTESARLMPLIPTATDTPEAAIKKLKALRNEYTGINSQIEDMYGDAEYRNPIITPKPITSGNVSVDIQDEEWQRMPQKQRRELLKQIEQDQKKAQSAVNNDPFKGFTPEQKKQSSQGGLTPEEQRELDELRARFKR